MIGWLIAAAAGWLFIKQRQGEAIPASTAGASGAANSGPQGIATPAPMNSSMIVNNGLAPFVSEERPLPPTKAPRRSPTASGRYLFDGPVSGHPNAVLLQAHPAVMVYPWIPQRPVTKKRETGPQGKTWTYRGPAKQAPLASEFMPPPKLEILTPTQQVGGVGTGAGGGGGGGGGYGGGIGGGGGHQLK